MRNNQKIPEFSGGCFWDQDYTKLNFDTGRRYIITRVISRGSSQDQKELFRFYGADTIKEEVVKIRYLNAKILNYISKLFDIPPENFRCYGNEGIF